MLFINEVVFCGKANLLTVELIGSNLMLDARLFTRFDNGAYKRHKQAKIYAEF